MVCVYCSSATRVVNSRLQKRVNRVWRRRVCTGCGTTFTSLERAAYDSVLMVMHATSHIAPFQHDKLFLSLYEACRHRPSAITDAAALTDTILHGLLALRRDRGILRRSDIIEVASSTLKRFDEAAYTHYAAFHPS